MPDSEERDEKSLGWIAVMAMILIAVVAWGCLANSYQSATAVADDSDEMYMPHGPVSARRMRARGGALFVSAAITIVANATLQVPNFLTVISWHFSNRIWLPIFFMILEAFVLLGVVGLKKLENKLSGNKKKRKKKRRK